MRIRLLLAFALLAVAACGNGSPPRLPQAVGATGQSEGAVPPGAAYVAGNSLVVGSQSYRLAATAGAPVVGALAPIAVVSPAADRYLYNSWAPGAGEECTDDPTRRGSCTQPDAGATYGRPTLRVFTTANSQDTVVEVGAVSAAWRSDGAIAYFKGDNPDVPVNGSGFVGHLYVRPSLTSSPARWTTDTARYVAVAWAGTTLIAYRQFEGERFDVLALGGPGAVRTLATDATVVAVSPDGTQLVINRDTGGTSAASVVDVSAGETLSTLEMGRVNDPQTGTPLAWLTYGGSWEDDVVAAESGSGVALFRVSSGRMRFDSVLLPKKSEYANGIHEPHLVKNKSGKLDLIAWAPIDTEAKNGRSHTIITCDVAAKSCRRNANRNERSVGIARANGRGRSK